MRSALSSLMAIALLAPIGFHPPFLFQQVSGKVPQTALQHEVSVSLKLIQVYVTDRKGKPIPDLIKDDFVVRDNGKEIKLTEFERHILESVPAGQKRLAAETKLELKATPLPPAVRMNRKLFLFFDFAFNHTQGIAKAKDAARHFIENESIPGDDLGLISYSVLKGLTIHEYLTPDHQKILEAIANFGSKETAGRAEDFEAEYWRRSERERDSIYAKSRFQAEAERKETKFQVQNFIIALTDLAKALRYIPGKKHLLLFSTGIVTSLIYYGMQGAPAGGNLALQNLDTGDFVLRTRYEDMLKEISASDCSFFAFDTREGALVSTMFDADREAFEERTKLIQGLDGARMPINVFKDDKTTGYYTLSRLADVTGGKYYSNIENYEKNLKEVASLTGSYYVLGYPMRETADGKYHTIEVEVKRKGAEIRAQSGYFGPKPFSEYSDLEKQLHLMDLALSDSPLLQTPVSFTMKGFSYRRGPGSRLLLLANVSDEAIKRCSGGKSEFVAIVFDAKKNLAGMRRLETDLTGLRIPNVLFAGEVVLPSGIYECRLVIRNMETGLAAVASVHAEIPPLSSAEFFLHSPLLIVPGGNTRMIEIKGKEGESSLWREAYPYDRAQFSPLMNELPRGSATIRALVPRTLSGRGSADLTIIAWLIDASTGVRIPLEGSILERSPNNLDDSIVAEISTGNLQPGRYYLYLQARDTASGFVSYAQTQLIIK